MGLQPGSGSGQVQLSFLGEPWRSYRLEASTDLVNWVPLTNLFVTNLFAQVMALDATVYPQRFYRSEAVVIRPQILGLSPTAGQVQLLLSGEIGRNYQIQTSADLTHWFPLQNVVLTNSVLLFTDSTAGNQDHRFYRVAFLY